MAARAESGRRDEDALMAGDVISIARGERSDDERRRAGELEGGGGEAAGFRVPAQLYLFGSHIWITSHISQPRHLTPHTSLLTRWPHSRHGKGCHALNLEPELALAGCWLAD